MCVKNQVELIIKLSEDKSLLRMRRNHFRNKSGGFVKEKLKRLIKLHLKRREEK